MFFFVERDQIGKKSEQPKLNEHFLVLKDASFQRTVCIELKQGSIPQTSHSKTDFIFIRKRIEPS
ncbi:hypothetical protein LEP1GSC036_4278 [Leptospira weilii str. 2006001853]|uniref:Uncharacterized protein n=2 Tax=Leptospira weilii TaxID=28184 RepID=A0A828YZG9_9LEPT|nr:hypothetical protein LEP1GSC036_4278 [Leptospira weilii str. 2006001853]EMN46241.1 hypothetical protein LEP1GSC086_3229 [Leptospira weilii str. LNT 1234]EMN90065.1 hypothetical protein LEP1GSC108_4647 [Leptospira weilii str. UI 13098]OMI17440.1 hypothetical protein BUQ74_10130 [Leptospira weilii serovar Heyan]QDK24190.1 hypothetical protein FHG67_16790 [Leptospira weilii]